MSEYESPIGLVEVTCIFYDKGDLIIRHHFETDFEDEFIEDYAEQIPFEQFDDKAKRLQASYGYTPREGMTEEARREHNEIWRMTTDQIGFMYSGPIGEWLTEGGYTSSISVSIDAIGWAEEIIDLETKQEWTEYAKMLRAKMGGNLPAVNFVVGFETKFTESSGPEGMEYDEETVYHGILDFTQLVFL